MRSTNEFIQDFRDSLSDMIDKDLTADYMQKSLPFGYCPECNRGIYNKQLHCRRCKGKLPISDDETRLPLIR